MLNELVASIVQNEDALWGLLPDSLKERIQASPTCEAPLVGFSPKVAAFTAWKVISPEYLTGVEEEVADALISAPQSIKEEAVRYLVSQALAVLPWETTLTDIMMRERPPKDIDWLGLGHDVGRSLYVWVMDATTTLSYRRTARILTVGTIGAFALTSLILWWYSKGK
ncbi:MAG: hypothetical protein DRJ03_07310 [Chloroflexi bacterium]|nr:MAG: hypothetical protein DRJ03_07310 [Chloroflexota bacterium]